ncbi:MAG: hypothetical protein GY768_10110 [Planctomycetaceae bacterium]|nr:hypothetical protein [Planctomycetaceae bacterium]
MNRLAVVKRPVSPHADVKHPASPLVVVSLPADVTADVVTDALVVCSRTCLTKLDVTRHAANQHADVSPLAVAKRPVSPHVDVKHPASPLVVVSLPADVTADVVTAVQVVCSRTC